MVASKSNWSSNIEVENTSNIEKLEEKDILGKKHEIGEWWGRRRMHDVEGEYAMDTGDYNNLSQTF